MQTTTRSQELAKLRRDFAAFDSGVATWGAIVTALESITDKDEIVRYEIDRARDNLTDCRVSCDDVIERAIIAGFGPDDF